MRAARAWCRLPECKKENYRRLVQKSPLLFLVKLIPTLSYRPDSAIRKKRNRANRKTQHDEI